MSRSPGERLLPLAAIASAVVLGISEFMTEFEVNAAGGDTLQTLQAGDRHWYAMLIIAVFAIAMIVLHTRSGARPPVMAATAVGVLAVMIFLVVDVPKVDDVGDLDEPAAGLVTARAEPQPGFWLALVGALGLTVSAGAMAALSADASTGSRRRERRDYQR